MFRMEPRPHVRARKWPKLGGIGNFHGGSRAFRVVQRISVDELPCQVLRKRTDPPFRCQRHVEKLVGFHFSMLPLT